MGNIWRQLLGIAVGGAWVLTASCVTAQITPDRTLPNNSSVTINGSVFNITGGTQAGRNLFHSFQQFSVPTRGTASFSNGLDIQNIISRVTGGSVSNIDGLIKASGTANLFFLNPSGIVFGKNASLNVGGSFVASTASGLKFTDGFVFSATTPQTTTPLLTVSVPSGLQFGSSPGEILVQGSGAIRGEQANTPLLNRSEGLQVPNQTLALVGGKVTIEGGILTTEQGRIELGSVAGNGSVSLTPINKGFSLNYAAGSNFDDIQLSKQAAIDALANGGGDIQLTGRRIVLTEGSEIKTTTNGANPGGTLVVNASDSVQIGGFSNSSNYFSSGLANESDRTATGRAGLLTINAHALFLQNGGFVDNITFGAGNGGNLSINAEEVQVSDGGSALIASVYKGSTGSGGNLTINTNQFLIQNGGFVGTDTSSGTSGDLTLNAVDFVHVIGTSPNGQNVSGLSTQAGNGSTGNAGKLTINTHELLVQGGGFVSTSTNGSGNAGNLKINADSVQVTGISPNGTISTVLAQAQDNATGTANDLEINTHELLVEGGAFVSTSISSSKSVSRESVGNLTINATDFVHVIGTSPDGNRVSGLSTQAEAGVTGAAGNLTINTHELLVQGGAFVSASTQSSGNAGNLKINADSVQVIGTRPDNGGSALLAQAEPGATGSGGNLTINTRQLLIKGGGFIGTDTYSSERAGNLTVNATDFIEVSGKSNVGNGSALSTQSGQISTGSAGNLTINTRQLLVKDGAVVSAGTFGSGTAGNLQVQARSIDLDNHAVIQATSSSGSGGNINLQVSDFLLMHHGSQISTSAGTAQQGGGNGGSITIHAPSGFVVATKNENNDITANAFFGSGGVIKIDALGIYNFNQRSLEDLKKILGNNDPTKLDPQQLLTNDITAISLTSPTLSGQVNIVTPSIDPTRGLVILPTVTENTSKPISSSCAAFNQTAVSSSFTVTGRGGLPPTPYEPLTSDVVLTDTRLPVITVQQRQYRTHPAKPKPQPIAIIPATGWVFNHKGEVTLISSASNATSSNIPTSCPAK